MTGALRGMAVRSWRRVAVLSLVAALAPGVVGAEQPSPSSLSQASPVKAVAVEDAVCAKKQPGQAVTVVRVLDGDTVKLTDGRKVRLLGVNTPELAHRAGEVDEPYAKEARSALVNLLKSQENRLELVLDTQAVDHYQRTLAYAFLPTGKHLNAELLRQGNGAAIVIPPNAAYAECFQIAEQLAQRGKKGIWTAQSFGPVSADDVDLGDERRFRLVRGKVTEVTRSGKSTLLTLDGGLQLKIADADAGKTKPDFGRWQGRDVEARGWVSNYRGVARIVLHHPSAFQLVQNSAPKKSVAPSSNTR
jgi:micrococcal nuclease